jgi:predicted permease
MLLLSLAIGGNSAMFSVVNTLLFRELAVPHPEQLRLCYCRNQGPQSGYVPISWPNFEDLRRGCAGFSRLAAFYPESVDLNQGEGFERISALRVSDGYFETLGTSLQAGRLFSGAELTGQTQPEVILSHAWWAKHGADPSILGRRIEINGQFHEVVGIAPVHCTGTSYLYSPQLWLPLQLAKPPGPTAAIAASLRSLGNLMVVGRLRPDATSAMVDTQLMVLSKQLAEAYPESNRTLSFEMGQIPRFSFGYEPVASDFLTTVSVVLLVASGLVLLIACSNLANLFLARHETRLPEFAIRQALGASRARLLGDFLVEGFLLALGGGVVGLGLAKVFTHMLSSLIAQRLTGLNTTTALILDWRVISVTLGLCLISTLWFAAGPGWRLARGVDLANLRETGSTNVANLSSTRLRSRSNLLVVGQLAGSLQLLVVTGGLLVGLWHCAQTDPGFGYREVIYVEIDPQASCSPAQYAGLFERIEECLRSIPGVQAITRASSAPLQWDPMVFFARNDAGETRSIPATGRQPGEVELRATYVDAVYFKTLDLPLLQGRALERIETENPEAPKGVVINAPLADRLWPGENPLGRFIHLRPWYGRQPPVLQVVGVVPGIRQEVLDQTLRPHLYLPMSQYFESRIVFHVRSANPGHAARLRLLSAIRQSLFNLNPPAPVVAVAEVGDLREGHFVAWLLRMITRLLAVFGGCGMFLAIVGIYGLNACLVNHRTREIGIRIALGAQQSDLMRLLLGRGIILVLAGVTLGAALSWAVALAFRATINAEFPGTQPVVRLDNPWIYGITILGLSLAALVAWYLPARRATRIDPVVALRNE